MMFSGVSGIGGGIVSLAGRPLFLGFCFLVFSLVLVMQLQFPIHFPNLLPVRLLLRSTAHRSVFIYETLQDPFDWLFFCCFRFDPFCLHFPCPPFCPHLV